MAWQDVRTRLGDEDAQERVEGRSQREEGEEGVIISLVTVRAVLGKREKSSGCGGADNHD